MNGSIFEIGDKVILKNVLNPANTDVMTISDRPKNGLVQVEYYDGFGSKKQDLPVDQLVIIEPKI